MVLDHTAEHPSQWAAIRSVGEKLGCSVEALRRWVRQAERDAGQRPGLTTSERDELKRLHRMLEGTIIDTILMNRLDGGAASLVNCLVSNPIYTASTQDVLIPAGARVIGTTKPVQSFGETRLAVSFARIVMPNPGMF